MLGLTSLEAFEAVALPAGTAPVAGQALSVQSGSTASTFNVQLATGSNACPGDSATGGFRWNSYMVPAAVDPATLTYGTSGPIAPAVGTFTQPLYSSVNAPLVNKNTAPDTAVVIGVGVVSFSAYQFLPGGVPNGTYRIGIVCTKDGQTERFWQSQVTFVGEPTAFNWTVDAGSTTTTVAGATTTTVAGATTTTVAGATTTTVAGATTTSTVRPTTTTSATTSTSTAVTATTTTAVAVASAGPTSTIGFSSQPVASGGFNSGSAIPVTGPSHAVMIAVWAILLLVFGRMAVLLARPIPVIVADR